MGVTGLWRLIEPAGKPVPLETLENKVLAVDVSIWLHQVIKGYQDARGGTVPNAHLLGLFNRLCKLLYYRVKPVFVFDGGVPNLKKETIAKRSMSRNKFVNESDRIQKQILDTIIKHKAIKDVLADKLNKKKSPIKVSSTPEKKLSQQQIEEENLFKLPQVVPLENSLNEIESEDIDSSSYSEDDNSNRSWGNINNVDVTGSHFRNLPADVRHDILTELKETRKQSSWGRLHELPDQSDEFSSFQMERLRKRRAVQVSLEEAESEMGGHTLSIGELEKILTEDGVLAASSSSSSKRIVSDDTKKFLLIKDVKKAKDEAKLLEEMGPSASKLPKIVEEKDGETTCTNNFILPNKKISLIDLSTPSTSKVDINLGNEYDNELQAAIQLSLENNSFNAEISEAIELSDDNNTSADSPMVELTEHQKKFFANTNLGLARAYMLENSGLTQEQILKLIEIDKNQTINEITHENILDISISEENKIFLETPKKTTSEINSIEESSSDDDSEFISVEPMENNHEIIKTNESVTKTNVLEININKNVVLEEDLFADIFLNSGAENKSEAVIEVKETEKFPKLSNLNDSFTIADTKKASPSKSVLTEIQQKLKLELENLNKLTNSFEINNRTLSIDLQQDDVTFKDDISEVISVNKIVENGDEVEIDTDMAIENTNSDNILESTRDKSNVTNTIMEEKDKPKVADTDIQIVPDLEIRESVSNTVGIQIVAEDVLKTPPRPAYTEEQLEGMARDVENEKNLLINEKLKQDRFATSISDQITRDAKELLQLFGIPYIDAPMEAEAQCAFLNDIKLTDGTITDDSDIWLFGGKTVYKNFFNQKKHVIEFKSDNIFNCFKLSREQLIQLALLVGSDYTTGLQGVGPVTALEILAAFPTQSPADSYDCHLLISGLQQFGKWVREGKSIGPGRTGLRNKLKNVTISENFPSVQVVEAYLEPKVETSKEHFTWGAPNLSILRDYTKTKFGWSISKTDDILLPVMSKMGERQSQLSIKSFFKVKDVKIANVEDRMSKRVQTAVGKITKVRDGCSVEQAEDETGNSTKTKVKRTRKPKDIKMVEANDLKTKKIVKKNATTLPKIIPKAREIIPQKEKDKMEILKNKMKAVEVFRKSKKGPGFLEKRNRAKPVIREDAGLSESSDE